MVKFDIQQIENTESSLKDLKSTLNEFNASIYDEFYEAFNQIDNTLNKLEQLHNQFKNKTNELVTQQKRLESRNSELRQANDTLRAELDRLRLIREKLEEERSILYDKLEVERSILDSCRDPVERTITYEDGSTTTEIYDPDKFVREAAIAAIKEINNQISALNKEIGHISEQMDIIWEKININNMYIDNITATIRDIEAVKQTIQNFVIRNANLQDALIEGKGKLKSISHQITTISSSVIHTIDRSLRRIQNTLEAAHKYIALFRRTSYRAHTDLNTLERNYHTYLTIIDSHNSHENKLKLSIEQVYNWEDEVRKQVEKELSENIWHMNYVLKEIEVLKVQNQKAIQCVKDYLSSRN